MWPARFKKFMDKFWVRRRVLEPSNRWKTSRNGFLGFLPLKFIFPWTFCFQFFDFKCRKKEYLQSKSHRKYIKIIFSLLKEKFLTKKSNKNLKLSGKLLFSKVFFMLLLIRSILNLINPLLLWIMNFEILEKTTISANVMFYVLIS